MIGYIEIEGFKSIKKMEMELKSINILIGSNGSGKSNFISFFKLINAIFNKRLQKFVLEEKVDNLLYFGRKTTKNLFGKLIFDSGKGNNNAYYFQLEQTVNGEIYIEREGSGYNVNRESESSNYFIDYNLLESNIFKYSSFRNNYLRKHLKNLQIFHFHDTSSTSLLRRECDLNDNLYLKQDGRNLPAFLYILKIKHPKVFNRIEKTIQSVAPYIDKFILEPNRLNEKEIELRWIDYGDPESNFSAYQLSDGTLRFIALATLLMQPEPPAVIIIDEPELGLHPFAIGKLAGMIQSASGKSQIIAATQSPGLISNFSPEDIIVIDKSEEQKQTVFNRLNSESLNIWLQEFTLGDLWERNIINSAQPFTK
ncbi:AAA family ATPase [Mucilaginibacter arboris]|uniref:AAA family ATPase n=1 Tax=Mucilaginibacter arboris TaxID=2682090 RepID=A0A7K1T0M4_9SPHI|nr:AAA family ATPase [Mucilaginibacter arboris]MVN23113.1 AAA family ATPase [Mucilaginibacter arboris]